MPKAPEIKQPPEIKAWLKSHGHDKDKVDKLKWTTLDDKRKSLCDLHGVSPQEYRAVKH